MKKILALFATAILVAFVSVANAGIVNSAHDFSGEGWNASGEICKPCHIPHNADTSVSGAPLWNHELSTVATYTLYSSSTLDATLGQPTNAQSKLCLSCHDGTVALENFGGNTTGVTYLTGFGSDLSDDHPISFTYDATLATNDGELYDPTSTNSGLGGTITADMLFSGSLECASCHDVHNAYNIAKLLVKSNAASALCLTCHNK